MCDFFFLAANFFSLLHVERTSLQYPSLTLLSASTIKARALITSIDEQLTYV